MRFFVTGGTGFIGRKLVQELVSKYGHESVVCFTFTQDNKLERTGRDILRGLGVKMIFGDIRTWKPSHEEIPEFDVVFHLAASTDTGEEDHSTNDIGTENLLTVLKERLNGTRVLYLSTTATIDRQGPANGPIDEDSPNVPRTEYGKTKLKAEKVIEEKHIAYGYKYTILRSSTVYGYGTRDNGLFDIFGRWVKSGNPLGRINWPGRTGLIHRDDLVRICIDFALRPETENELFCVVTESPPIGDIPREMAKALDIPFKQINIPEWVWRLGRLFLRAPGLRSIGPASLRRNFWRLSLIVDHCLWCDGAKMCRLYKEPLLRLDDGIYDVMGKRIASTKAEN